MVSLAFIVLPFKKWKCYRLLEIQIINLQNIYTSISNFKIYFIVPFILCICFTILKFLKKNSCTIASLQAIIFNLPRLVDINFCWLKSKNKISSNYVYVYAYLRTMSSRKVLIKLIMLWKLRGQSSTSADDMTEQKKLLENFLSRRRSSSKLITQWVLQRLILN